jgi:hypothetical protein
MVLRPSTACFPERGFDRLHFTLVDCPGHAGLIRTIIGGAQIIDMVTPGARKPRVCLRESQTRRRR